jgi:hypothetical protein
MLGLTNLTECSKENNLFLNNWEKKYKELNKQRNNHGIKQNKRFYQHGGGKARAFYVTNK